MVSILPTPTPTSTPAGQAQYTPATVGTIATVRQIIGKVNTDRATPPEAITSSTMSKPADLTPQKGTPAQAPVKQSNALIILQTVKHHHFSSLAKVSAYFKILSPKERFRIVNKQASKLVAVQEKVDKYMEYLEDFVGEDDIFKDRMANDPEVWTKISGGAGRARASEKKQQALN